MVLARFGTGNVGLCHPSLGGYVGLGDAGGLAQFLQVHLEQLLLHLGLDASTALRRELALGESVRPLVQLHGFSSCRPLACSSRYSLQIRSARGMIRS